MCVLGGVGGGRGGGGVHACIHCRCLGVSVCLCVHIINK